jgi:hypothetical protein
MLDVYYVLVCMTYNTLSELIFNNHQSSHFHTDLGQLKLVVNILFNLADTCIRNIITISEVNRG